MTRTLKYLIGLIAVTAAMLTAAGTVSADSGRLALVSDDTPVVQFHRDSNGSFRYELNNDLLLGMSMGVSPAGLSDTLGIASGNRRWHPVFNLLATPPRKSNIYLPEYQTRPNRHMRWYLSFGRRHHKQRVNEFDFRDDLSSHFSLQTQAGFLVRMSKNLVLGGAITLDYATDRRSFADDRGGGAYLGLRYDF